MLYSANSVQAAVGVLTEQGVRLVAQTVGIGSNPGGAHHTR